MQSNTYFISTERLGFRKWQPADMPLAMELWGDPQVTRLLANKPLDKYRVEERLLTEIQVESTHGVQYWPLFLLSGDIHIGCCGLRPYDVDREIYEIGFHLKPAYWGNGYATEAALAVIEHGFQTLIAKAIFAGHHPENASSRKLLLKLGFDETKPEYYLPTGLHHPSYLLRSEKREKQTHPS